MRCTIVALLCAAACGGGKREPAATTQIDAAGTTAPPPRRSYQVDVEERLAKLERTVAKLTAALDQQLGKPAPDPAAIYAIPIDPRDPIDGPADAKVTMIFAFDLIDPFTALAAPIVIATAAKHPADVRIVWKYLSLGPPAVGPGVIACGAAAQHKWPAARDALFAALYTPDPVQPKPHPEKAAFEQLLPLATAAGLDTHQLELARGPCEAWFETSKTALAAAGTYTTPALYVNGRAAGGLRDAASLDALVTAAIATATQQMAADHVGAAEFYNREIMAKGLAKLRGRFDD